MRDCASISQNTNSKSGKKRNARKIFQKIISKPWNFFSIIKEENRIFCGNNLMSGLEKDYPNGDKHQIIINFQALSQ
jgi:hypothetical protein